MNSPNSYLAKLVELDAVYRAKLEESIRMESDYCSGKGGTNSQMNAAFHEAARAKDALREAIWMAWPYIRDELGISATDGSQR
jgi:hypothetical protein